MIANSWHAPCLRFFAFCIMFSAGIRPAASDVVHAHMYWPWPGFSGDFPRQDVVKALHGLTGTDFVRGYINQLHPRISSLVMPYAGLFHSPKSEFNLFTKYRSDLGLVTSGVWLPDTSEADSRSAFQASSGFQQGYHLCRGAVPRVVAANLSKLEHVSEALHVSDTPLDVSAPLALSSRFAVDKCAELGPHVVDARRKVIRHFRRMAHKLRRLNDELVALMPDSVRRVASDVHAAFLLYAMILIAWPDPAYIEGVIFGFPLLGMLERPPFSGARSLRAPC